MYVILTGLDTGGVEKGKEKGGGSLLDVLEVLDGLDGPDLPDLPDLLDVLDTGLRFVDLAAAARPPP